MGKFGPFAHVWFHELTECLNIAGIIYKVELVQAKRMALKLYENDDRFDLNSDLNSPLNRILQGIKES